MIGLRTAVRPVGSAGSKDGAGLQPHPQPPGSPAAAGLAANRRLPPSAASPQLAADFAVRPAWALSATRAASAAREDRRKGDARNCRSPCPGRAATLGAAPQGRDPGLECDDLACKARMSAPGPRRGVLPRRRAAAAERRHPCGNCTASLPAVQRRSYPATKGPQGRERLPPHSRPRSERASLKVFDGRITTSVFAGSGR